MIEVLYDRKKHRVTVKGHAGSAEKGQDLVCSAVSSLVYTLSADVNNLCVNRKQVRRPVVELKEGDATISCKPVHGFDHVVELVFDSVCSGFDLLAKQYPEYVRYEINGN